MSRDERALGLRRGTTAIHEYDPRWGAEFGLEAALLRTILGEPAPAIEHIGSTAVPGLPAKPVLDVAIALADTAELGRARRRLSASGYEERGDQGDDGGVVFAKGPASARTHYVHLVPHESAQWAGYLAFRAALRRDPIRREAYATLKKDLAARFPSDRVAYQGGKREFIEETIGLSSTLPRRGLW
jgi:GrpB-like predicted nucleotidyltransferase (UPF0157 family)